MVYRHCSGGSDGFVHSLFGIIDKGHGTARVMVLFFFEVTSHGRGSRSTKPSTANNQRRAALSCLNKRQNGLEEKHPPGELLLNQSLLTCSIAEAA